MTRYLLTIALVLAAGAAHAQVSCQRIGNSTFCSNGLSSQQIGNQTYFNNGVTRQDIGNQQFYTAPTYVPPPVIYQPAPMQPMYPTPYHR